MRKLFSVVILLLSVVSANAATPFTTFSFSATHGTGSRTDPDRWADTVNVKDYGAKGDGSTDDTSRIQAAINQAITNGGGIVFFPEGTYVTSSALVFTTASSTQPIALVGTGVNSHISGTVVSDYVIKKTDDGFQSLTEISNMEIEQHDTGAGSGAIELLGSNGASFNRLTIASYGGHGIRTDTNSFNVAINDCQINHSGTFSSSAVGATLGQSGVYNTVFMGWGTGLGMGINQSDLGLAVVGSRFEANHIGIDLGVSNEIDSAFITSTSMERNDYGIVVNSASNVHISAVTITSSGSPPSGNPITGVQIGSIGQGITITSVDADTGFTTAGIDLSTMTGGGYVTIASSYFNAESGGGVNWKLPAHGNQNESNVTYINSNNPYTGFPFSSLPGRSGVPLNTAIEGMQYQISDGLAASCGDSACTTWATTVTGGGGALHLVVRYNGSNWTLVAK